MAAQGARIGQFTKQEESNVTFRGKPKLRSILSLFYYGLLFIQIQCTPVQLVCTYLYCTCSRTQYSMTIIIQETHPHGFVLVPVYFIKHSISCYIYYTRLLLQCPFPHTPTLLHTQPAPRVHDLQSPLFPHPNLNTLLRPGNPSIHSVTLTRYRYPSTVISTLYGAWCACLESSLKMLVRLPSYF